MRAMTMMAPMMAPTTAPLMVPTLAPPLQQYQQEVQQELQQQEEQFYGQYPQQLQQLQQQQQLQQLMGWYENNYKTCWIQSVLLFALNKFKHRPYPPPPGPSSSSHQQTAARGTPSLLFTFLCLLPRNSGSIRLNTAPTHVQITIGNFHKAMGNCCYNDDNIDYGMLVPERPPPKETNEYRREAHPDSSAYPKQTSNLPPQPPNRLSGAPGNDERQSYFKKSSSINENAPHLRQYHHVHIVKPPSYLQSSGQMAMFQDDRNLGRLMNPNLAIRTSNPPYKPSLEGIREQQMTYI